MIIKTDREGKFNITTLVSKLLSREPVSPPEVPALAILLQSIELLPEEKKKSSNPENNKTD